jgi:tetrahydromethanopterin S-methyltransferase subunit A
MMEAGQAMYGTVETSIGAESSEANRCSNTSIRYIVSHDAAQ